MAKYWSVFLLFCFVFLPTLEVDAQCVMCKAVADDVAQNNQQAGKAINNGILYIMAVPYLCLVVLFMYFFGPKKVKSFLKNLVGQA